MPESATSCTCAPIEITGVTGQVYTTDDLALDTNMLVPLNHNEIVTFREWAVEGQF
jgi:hypothetical protein